MKLIWVTTRELLLILAMLSMSHLSSAEQTSTYWDGGAKPASTAQEPPPPDTPSYRFNYCLISNAAQLDDRVSPADVVGRIVVRACANEWKEVLSSVEIPEASRPTAGAELERYAADQGTAAVLMVRKANNDTAATEQEAAIKQQAAEATSAERRRKWAAVGAALQQTSRNMQQQQMQQQLLYQQQRPRQTNCTTNYIGGQAHTNCTQY